MISMMAGIGAMRKTPNIKSIKVLPSDKLVMSPARIKIYNAYMSGVTDVKKIIDIAKTSDSFTRISLRQFADQGMIKLERNPVSLGRRERKAECLTLVNCGEYDIPKLSEKVKVSIGAIRKYLLELKAEGMVIYHPGKANSKYTLYAKEAA